VRAIRFVLLLIVLAVAFIATPTFELRPLASHLPPDFLSDSALLAAFRQWVAGDVARMSLVLTSWAALTFGLLAVPWPFYTGSLHKGSFFSHSQASQAQTQAQTQQSQEPTRRSISVRWWFGMVLILAAVIAVAGMFVILLRVGDLPSAHLLWVVGILLLLLGASLFPRPLSPTAMTTGDTGPMPFLSQPRATSGWPLVLFVVLLGAMLYSWKLTVTPASVDDTTAQLGLQALAMANGETPLLFHVQDALSHADERIFGVAAVSTTFFYWITGDLLLSTRLIGLAAALFCAIATWLVGIELFARRATPANVSIPIEDNGQSPALIALWLVLFNMAVLYFSRRPILLEAMAWGTMGCWALLRAFRTRDRLALSLSGVLVGFSYLLHGGSITFGITTLLWWAGFAVMQIGVLPHWAPTPARKRLHLGDWLLWLLGILMVLAPVAMARSQELLAWREQLPSSIESALTMLLANVAPPVDVYPAPLLPMVLLPFIPLALGALLFNLDRRQGWVLTSWLSSTFLIVAAIQLQDLRWELLVFIIPVVALTLAFTLDRLRVSLIRVGGSWTQQFVGILLLGLLLWIGSDVLISYHTFALRQVDRVSAIGYALRSVPLEEPFLVYLPNESMATFPLTAENAQSNPLLRFLTNDFINNPDSSVKFVDSISNTVRPNTVIAVLPEETEALSYLRAVYPDATTKVVRDIQSNPLVALFTIQRVQQ